MHYLLYVIAGVSAVIGAFWGNHTGNLSFISSGMMAAVLFGSLGRVIHLLVQIEDHLGHGKKRKE
jgi:hypothetical protein